MSKLGEPKEEPLNAAAQLNRLRDWLLQEVGTNLPQKRRSVSPSQGLDAYQAQHLEVNAFDKAYSMVLEKMEDIASGSRQPDPLGADALPSLEETAELEDL